MAHYVVNAALQPHNLEKPKHYEALVGIGIMDASAPDPEGVVLCNTF